MAVLATSSDVETAIGRSLTGPETARVAQLLATASDAVTAEANGFRFAPGDYTAARRVRRGRIRLPAKVDSVTSVSGVDERTGLATPLTGWTLAGNTVYGVDACMAIVEFTVTAAVPATVVALVAGVVAATVTGPVAGAQSMGAGPFTVSFVDGTGRVWLSKSDKAILARFRSPKPAIELVV